MATISLCGLLAATTSVILGTLAAVIAMWTALLADRLIRSDTRASAQIWLVSQAAIFCSIPVLTLPTLRVVVMAAILTTWLFVIWGRITLNTSAIVGWCTYYATLGLSTIFYSPEDDGALLVFLIYAATAIPAAGLAGSLISRSDLPALVASLYTGVSFQVGITIYEVVKRQETIWRLQIEGKLLDPEQFTNTLVDGIARGTGTFGHPLPQALLYVVAFSVALTLARYNWFITTLICSICVAGAILGSARSALLSMTIVTILAIIKWSRLASMVLLTSIVAGTTLVADNLDWSSTIGFDNFAATGSYTHRMGVIQTLPNLLDRTILEVLFGNGVRGQTLILEHLNDKLSAVDNQFINAIILSGFLGATGLAWVMLAAYRNSPPLRLVIVGMLLMFFSFDALSWQSTLAVVATLCGLACSPRLWTTSGQRHAGSDKTGDTKSQARM
ncbi:hypothetical protein IA539_23260 [Gordonia sp. zg691]|nr:hypothetical protein [Gordonia jinghuaiqii]